MFCTYIISLIISVIIMVYNLLTCRFFHLLYCLQERESGLNELSRRRERDATQREVDKLRASIQTLTRSANPLGKLMDFLQEDVDSMQVMICFTIAYMFN